MRRWIPVIAVLVALTLFSAMDLSAAPFYDGKVVRVTVGFSPGLALSSRLKTRMLQVFESCKKTSLCWVSTATEL